MEIDVLHDYNGFPEDEVENSVEALKDYGHKHVETFRETKNVGRDTLYLAVILYEEKSNG